MLKLWVASEKDIFLNVVTQIAFALTALEVTMFLIMIFQVIMECVDLQA